MDPVSETEATAASSAAPDARLGAIETRLGALAELFEARLQYDAAKDRAFDVLYEKMQQFDGDFQASLKQNLIMSLLRLHDRMDNAEAALTDQPDARQQVRELRQHLLDILYAETVEPIGTLADKFDCRRQQAVETVPTTASAEADTVERVVREGFISAGRILRPQAVVVRCYRGPLLHPENLVQEGA